MVAPPELASYSSDQLARSRATLRAVEQYTQLLQVAHLDPLHRQRHEAWLRCAMATHHGTAPTEEICRFWSATADAILLKVWREVGLEQFQASLWALGKHGCEELNLSSDIDLMIVAEPQEAFEVERRLRRFQQRLQAPGEYGFCYRLDFDLRPGGQMGPLIVTPSQFQDYYWSQGETWERLALVRLRQIIGPADLENQILELAKRFSFRKFLDFTLLEDLKALRSRVHQRGFVRKDHELHIKLDIGGIRDIELFIHSQLILHGGKLKSLQVRSTTKAIRLLEEHHLLSSHDADLLLQSYWQFRHYENSLQMMEDRQTHALTDASLERLALPARQEVLEQMRRVDLVVSTLLGRVDLSQEHLPASDTDQRQWLKDLGFSSSVIASAWPQLMGATALSHKNDRDERARREFLYVFVMELAKLKNLDRDLGLQLLVDFVRATRAKATFFSMLLGSPRLIQDIARLLCLSPYLGSLLASRPELLDHFILRVDETWASEMSALLEQMSERKMLNELWTANQLLKDHDLLALFERSTTTADEINSQLLHQLKNEFPEATLNIIALGKWGGRELGLRSDLDFIFVTPDLPREADFKVARRLISRLTDPLKAGHLYDIDLRLRPSGQSGALLVSESQLSDYWQTRAQPWERQAYLKSRPLQPQTLNLAPLIQRPLSPADVLELERIRQKLLQPATSEELDLKHIPGGLIDIEFTAQIAFLHLQRLPADRSTHGMIRQLKDLSPFWQTHGPQLEKIYLRLRLIEQMSHLSSAYKLRVLKKESQEFNKTVALLGLNGMEAWDEILELSQTAQSSISEFNNTISRRELS